MIKTLTLLLITSSVWAGSVRLVNDTKYTLRAVIQGSKGDTLGELIVKAGQTSGWTDNYGYTGFSKTPEPEAQTPYTITWLCPEGKTFSTCYNIPSGTIAIATNGDGNHSCQ
jgi:hypothetical protein